MGAPGSSGSCQVSVWEGWEGSATTTDVGVVVCFMVILVVLLLNEYFELSQMLLQAIYCGP